MRFGDKNPLISPNQLINSIDSFAASVARYLSPVIRFVGHKDQYFDTLYRKFPDLHHEKRFSGEPAHLVVFDEIPQSFLDKNSTLPIDSAYIFCLDDSEILTDEQRSLLRNRVSVTLYDPDPEELYWHAKALLMVQDVSFNNSLFSFPELMSVDVEFRRSLAQLIVASINSKSSIAFVESGRLKDAVEMFLFGSLPSVVSPFKASLDSLDKHSLPDDRSTLVDVVCNSPEEIEHALTVLEPCTYSKSVIAFITCNSLVHENISSSSDIVFLKDLRERNIDSQLIAHWCATFMSSLFEKPRYFSNEQIKSALNESNYSSPLFIDALLADNPGLNEPNKSFNELISKYDRPSIDDLLNEAELKIMLYLESRAGIKDAASSAAGIPTVTFRKRLKRLERKESLIGLISNSDADT